MAKKIAQDAERRAMAAKVLAERKRTERRRSALILGACIVVVVGLLAAALIPYFKDKQDAEVVGTAIEKLGVTETAAHCDPVTEKSADGSGRKCCRSDIQAWGSSRKQTCVSDADALAQTAGHSAANRRRTRHPPQDHQIRSPKSRDLRLTPKLGTVRCGPHPPPILITLNDLRGVADRGLDAKRERGQREAHGPPCRRHVLT